MDTSKEHTFISACSDFFGRKEGQDLKGFNEEIKQLTPADREEIKSGLEANGYKFKAA